MPEPPSISQEDLRKLLVLRPVRMRMLKIAYNRARSIADAKDLVSEATLILLRGSSPWRPDPDRSVEDQIDAFVVHAALVIRRCHLNKVTSAAARRAAELPEELADSVGDGRSNVEQTAIDLEWEQQHERRATVWVDALCTRMAKDGDALAVLGQHRLGVHDAEAQATALGWPSARLVLAKRRIAYHAPLVMAEQLEAERQAEEQRLEAAKAAEKERVQP